MDATPIPIPPIKDKTETAYFFIKHLFNEIRKVKDRKHEKNDKIIQV